MKCVLVGFSSLFLAVTFAQVQMTQLRITTEKQQEIKRTVTTQAKARSEGNVTYSFPEEAKRSQAVVMNIKLQNMTAKDLNGLTVKYTLFSKNRSTSKVKSAAQGQKTADVKSLQTVKVETDPADFESEETTYRHGPFSDQNKRNGQQYYGIAVEVYAGANKIASYYEPPGVEQQAGKLDAQP